MKRFALIMLVLGLSFLTETAQADWSTVKRLTWTSGVSSSPVVAVGSADSLHVVWQEYIDGSLEIAYKKSTNSGASWSPNRRLTWTDGWTGDSAIVSNPSGALSVAWEDVVTPGNGEIYFKRSPDGGTTWNPAERLTWKSGYSRSPALAVESSDTVHLTWADETSGNYEIYYRKTTDGGSTWSAAKRLTWTSDYSGSPAMAINSSNHIHIVWHESSTEFDAQIYYRKSTDGGASWGAVKRLTWSSGLSLSPAIVIDSNETIHAVWDDDKTGNSEIYYRRSSNGGATWSSAKRLTWTSEQSAYSSLAVDSKNTLHLIWRDYTPGNYEIYYKNSADGGVTWSPALRLTRTSGASMNPTMAIDSGDTIHIVWDDNTPGNTEIYYKNGN